MNAMHVWQEASGAMPKLFSPALGLRRLLLLALLALAIFASGCKRECVEPDPDDNGFCGIPPGMGCTTMVTVRKATCGSGIWGDMWLQLDNGQYLQPWDSNVTLTQQVTEGQRFRINYDVVTRDNRQHPGAVCLAMPPQADAIRITCLTPEMECQMPELGCNVSVTAANAMCGAGYWGSIWFKLDDGTYLQPWEVKAASMRIEAGKRYRIGYEKMARDNRYDGTVTCMAMPPDADAVRIICLREENLNEPH